MDMRSKKVLVTGGSGYFGSSLCCSLVQRGDEVFNFDLVPYDEPVEGVSVTVGDIRNFQDILKATAGMDVVHHNVAQVPIAKNRALFESVNYKGTYNLLEAALRNGVKKVIYMSSSAVFGRAEKLPLDETVEPRPIEPYGKSKYEGELMCREYMKKGLDITIIRPRTIIGPGRLGIFQILFDWIHCNKAIYTLGKGDNLHQFVHADDLVQACILAADSPGCDLFNVGTDRFGTMRHSLEGLLCAVGSHSTVRSLPKRTAQVVMQLASTLRLSPLATLHTKLYGEPFYFDITHAKNKLRWAPKWSNVEMLTHAYHWYVEHLQTIFSGQNRSKHRSPMKQGILKLLKLFG